MRRTFCYFPNLKWCLLPVPVFFLLIFSCKPKNDIPDVSHINMEVHIQRFEKDLFALNPSSIEQEIPTLASDYPDFFDLYSAKVIEIGKKTNPAFPEYLKLFITDYINYQVYEKVLEKYPYLEELEDKLTNGFKYYNYYFPEKPVPRMVSCISGFNYGIVTADSIIGICLDNYLGREEVFYTQLGIYNYRKRNMIPEKIPSDLFQIWGSTEFPYYDSINTLVNRMIYEGRNMYFVTKMLPMEPDTLIWGFTPQQLNFSQANEEQMWTYLIENKFLFSQKKFVINKFIQEGPFTKEFTTGSPGRAAIWIGYKIIQSYLKHNPEVSFPELMGYIDYQNILNNSAYNP